MDWGAPLSCARWDCPGLGFFELDSDGIKNWLFGLSQDKEVREGVSGCSLWGSGIN